MRILHLLTTMIVAACAWLMVQPASAQTCPERTDTEILAILTVHEAGWHSDGDMVSIYLVISNLARNWGVSFAQAACMHSTRLMQGRTSRPWASDLTAACTRPARWPTTTWVCDEETGLCGAEPYAPWENYEDRCHSLMERAATTLRTVHGTCSATTWGGVIDFDPERRRRPLSGTREWVDVACVPGDTRQRYGYWVAR